MSVKSLYDAIRQCDVDKVTALLENPAIAKKINQAPKEENETVLTLAVTLNDNRETSDLGWKASIAVASIVRALMKHGADITVRNFSGKTALHICAYEGKVNAATAILESFKAVDCGDERDKTPLYWAVKQNQKDMVKLLLEAGANPAAIINVTGDSVAHEAIMTADIEIVKAILSKLPSPDLQNNLGQSLVYYAALTDRDVVVEILVERGASLGLLAANNASPIHACARLNHLKVLNLLVDRAEVSTSYLDTAIKNGSEEINKTETEVSGWTALHMAVAQGHTEAVEILRRAGVNNDAKTGAGKSALDLATLYKRNNNIITLLGGKPEQEKKEKAKPPFKTTAKPREWKYTH